MAKLLLACYPIAGHLNPNMALGSALQAAGHEVAIYSGSLARSTVERAGFVFFPFNKGMDEKLTRIWLPAEGPSFAANISTRRVPLFEINGTRTTMEAWFLSTVPQQVEDLRAIIKTWQPDILVTDISIFAPIIILQETEAIPVAAFCVLLACPLPGPDAPTWGRGLPPPNNWFNRLQSKLEKIAQDWVLAGFRAKVNNLRLRYGLSPLQETVMAFCRQLPLFLVAGTPELDYNRGDLPPSVHYIGPCLWHRPQDTSLPAWLSALPDDRPVVYVTEGTVHVEKPFVLQAAAQGLGNTALEVIMTTGTQRDPADLALGLVASNIRIEAYVPHGDLFPRTDVVVTTGGPGTILAALSAGIPLIIIATGWDHSENAQRIVQAGVGIRILPKNCTPENLRRAVEKVLHCPTYKRNAERIGQALARQGGPPQAVELLERLFTKSEERGSR